MQIKATWRWTLNLWKLNKKIKNLKRMAMNPFFFKKLNKIYKTNLIFLKGEGG